MPPRRQSSLLTVATYPPLHVGKSGVRGAILPLQSQEESMPQVEANGLMLEVEELSLQQQQMVLFR